ncbi:MAG: hypothetical protein MUP86_02525 [Dehalococcoidia bacterium]|nr:hypothetical protein [Dehalococcoidia bacterium]
MDAPPRLGTTDDVDALEQIMGLAAYHSATLEAAEVRLQRIFELASARIKGDDEDIDAGEDPRVRNSPLRGVLDYYQGKYGGPFYPNSPAMRNWTDLHGRQGG